MRVLHVLEATRGGTARHLELVARWLPAHGIAICAAVSPVRNPAFPERLRGIPLQSPQASEAEDPKPSASAEDDPPADEGAGETSAPPAEPGEDERHPGRESHEESAQPQSARATASGPDPTRVFELPMRRAISPVEDFSAYIALRRLMKAERPAVVHTHASKAGFLGRAAARALGIPVVHTPHVMPMEWSGSVLYLALERRAAKWTDRLVVLNDRQETLARDKLELPSDRIRYLVNGVDVDAFYPATPVVFARARRKLEVREMRPLVGIAARLEPQKGVGTFIGAAAQVLEEQPRAIFLIAGSGSLQPELERRCAKLGIEKSVRFLGEQALMPSFYHALDVFALASLWEGMPYAILEAQASGLAVVATSTPGAQALIRPGETGSLVRLDDPTSMASAICTYLADQRLRDRVGRRAREAVVAHHSVQQWAERLAGLYRELVPDGSGT